MIFLSFYTPIAVLFLMILDESLTRYHLEKHWKLVGHCWL